jgi:oligo-1,6-glucosidase
MKISSRDNGRTPMQWDTTINGGFSTGKPWLPTNENYKKVNVTSEDTDANSILNYFRKMQKLRKENDVLIYGKFTLIDASNPDVFAYTRELSGKRLLVLLNFKNKIASVNSGVDLTKAKILINNYSLASTDGKLKPYEAVIYQIQ